jgi:hypothetical protein
MIADLPEFPDNRHTVDLRLAYEWVCESCGKTNFESALIVELDNEDSMILLEEYGGAIEDYRTGDWLTRPDDVECQFCHTEFKTTDDLPEGQDGDFPDDFDVDVEDEYNPECD